MQCNASKYGTLLNGFKVKYLPGKISKIMLAVDGSGAAKRAADYALNLSSTLGAELAAIHVIDVPPVMRGMNPALAAMYIARADKQSSRWLDEVEHKARKLGISVTREVIVGRDSVPDGIIGFARKSRPDMIIMGTRGRTATRKLLLGSVAFAVSALAPCPVVLVR